MPAIISLILLRIEEWAEPGRKSRKLHSVALILSSPQSVLFSIYFLSKGEGPRVERRVFGEIGFISINDLTFTNWFYLEINLLESMQSVVFVLSASVLRFIFQYSFIRLLWWHTAGEGSLPRLFIIHKAGRMLRFYLVRVEILIHHGPLFLLEVTASVWFPNFQQNT